MDCERKTMNRSEQKEQYYVVDILKFVFCLFVICIHTNILEHFPLTAGYWIEKLLFRLAVPFFFITSGLLLGKKIELCKNSDDIKIIIQKYTKRLLHMLLIFEPISIIINSLIYHQQGYSATTIALITLRDIVFYPKGALWYIQACIIASWIIYVFIKYKKEKLMGFLAMLFYLFALLCNSYYSLIEHTFFSKYIDFYLRIAVSARNGLFVGVPFLYLGIMLYRFTASSNIINSNSTLLFGGFVVIFGLYALELFSIRDIQMKDDGSLFVLTPFLVSSLLLFALKFKGKQRKYFILIRNLSTGMYLTHSPINLIIYYGILGAFDVQLPGSVRLMIVLLISSLICMLSYKSKNNRINTLLR